MPIKDRISELGSKLNKQKLDKINGIVTCIFLLIYNVPMILTNGKLKSSIIYFTMERMYLVFGLALLVCYFSLRKAERKKACLVRTDVFLIGMFLLTTVSLIFTTDFTTSIFGNTKRIFTDRYCEVCLYYLLFFLAGCIDDGRVKQWIIRSIVIVAVANYILMALQAFDIVHSNKKYYAFGFTTNSNHIGAFSVIVFALGCAALVFSKTRTETICAIALTFIDICSVIFSNARLALGGVIVIAATLVIMMTIKLRQEKKSVKPILLKVLIITVMFFVCAFVINSVNGAYSQHIVGDTVAETESGDFDELGSDRGVIWKKCVKAIPDYWTTGVGVGCYKFLVDELQIIKSNGDYAPINGAHNEFLNILMTEGLAQCLLYFSFVLFLLINAVKRFFKAVSNEEKLMALALLLVLMGYVVQSCFGVRNFNVAMYFWVLIGMIIPRSEQKPLFHKRKNSVTE